MQLTTEEFHDLAQRLYSPKPEPMVESVSIEAAWSTFWMTKTDFDSLTEKEFFEAGFRAARES